MGRRLKLFLIEMQQYNSSRSSRKNLVSLDQMSIPRTAAHTDKAPQPYGGLYSQAVIANGVVYCSGIVAIDPETGKLIDGDVKAHTVRKSTPY